MTIILDGASLTVEKLVRIAREGEQVELDPAAVERIKVCRAMLEEKIEAREIMYGTNTGIGEFSEIVLDDDQVQQFQRYLVYNHAAGIGEPAPIEVVRAAMAARVNVHAHGNSGNRLEITLTLVEMLNKGVTPVMCEKGLGGRLRRPRPHGSDGAGHDGRGRVVLPGRAHAQRRGHRARRHPRPGAGGARRPGHHQRLQRPHGDERAALLRRRPLAAPGRDRLRHEPRGAARQPQAVQRKLHELRGFAGAMRSAAAITKPASRSSDLATGKIKTKVQDAYSMRSTPQVIGAAHDALRWAKSQVEIELNGVGDNPILVPEEKLTLTGANFQGTPVSLPMEMVGQAITMVSVLSERRLNRLENTATSQGLPDFLTPNPGFYSGLMLSQYTADMLITEQRILSAPAATMSIPAAADQEDFVSMGMNTALKNRQILENAYGVLGIEFMARRPGARLPRLHARQGVRAAKAVIREHVDHLDVDRPLFPDHNAMAALVESCEILDAVEAEVGPLG